MAKTDDLMPKTPAETPGFGTLFTLAKAFLPNLAMPQLVKSPPLGGEDALEARIHKAETRYQALVEQIPAVTFMVSFENRQSEIYVSPHIESMLGYTAEEWVSNPILWYQRLHSDDKERWNQEFAKTIAFAEPFKSDYRFIAKDGRTVWIHGEVTVARDETGRPSFLQGIGYDITDLKKAEEVLRRSQEDLEALAKERTAEVLRVNQTLKAEIAHRELAEETMRRNLKELAELRAALDEHAIVAVTDPQGRITYTNEKFCSISKYSREELIGQDHRIINSGHHSKEFIRDLWTTIAGGRVWKGEICNRAKDGSLYWVDTTIVPFLGQNGKPAQYVAIRADISERKAAQSKQNELMRDLKEINEELNQFAYVVSHDLKAPLRAISSLADWLVTDYGELLGEEGKDQFRLLQGRVARMNALVDGILRYSRISRQHEERVLVDVNELLKDVCELLSPPTGVTIHVAESFPTVVCERTRLWQVFENLTSNAIKYMGKPTGDIYIGWTDAGTHWRFDVRDTGPGIEQKYFEKIFLIFQTLTPRDERESTGIGLALVKKNVELFGGKTWLESEVGVGTTFFFTVPKNPAEGSKGRREGGKA